MKLLESRLSHLWVGYFRLKFSGAAFKKLDGLCVCILDFLPLINENLIQENQKRRCYDYVPQQRILKKKRNPRKLGKRTSGPYRTLQTHVNGTLTLELRPGVSERINIRRVIPYSHTENRPRHIIIRWVKLYGEQTPVT